MQTGSPPAAHAAQHRRHHPRSTVAAGLLAAISLALSACGGDDDDSDSTTTTSAEPATTTPAPPAAGESQEDAFAAVREVAHEATDLVDGLFQNPEVVTDPDNEDITRLRELYVDGSGTPDGVVTQLEQLAANDQQVRAAGDVLRDLGVYQLTAVDENTVRFRVCAVEDRETVDADGQVVDVVAQVTQGDGEAHRIDGVWRLQGIEPRADLTLPFEPGSADTGFCDQAYGEAGGP